MSISSLSISLIFHPLVGFLVGSAFHWHQQASGSFIKNYFWNLLLLLIHLFSWFFRGTFKYYAIITKCPQQGVQPYSHLFNFGSPSPLERSKLHLNPLLPPPFISTSNPHKSSEFCNEAL